LKPDVYPTRRRSAGVDRARALSLERALAPYLVRMIEPNSIRSHDWHVQPICQRSLRALRLSGTPLDRGPGCYAKVSSNLLRWLCLRFLAPFQPFWRELSNLIGLPPSCQPPYFRFPQARPDSMPASVPCVEKRVRRARNVPGRKLSRSANIKERPVMPEPLRLAGNFPGSCNGLFSEGFPTGAQGVQSTSPDPTNRLPLHP
jgi:hypothetical protein